MKNNRKKEYKTGQGYGEILGIKINSTSKMRVLRYVREQINKAKKFFIVTPNPEIILKAQKDEQLKIALCSADLSLPDGVGLVATNKFLGLPNPKNPVKRLFVLLAQGLGVGFSVFFDKTWLYEDFQTVKGREMFMEFIKLANKKGWKVFLLGDRKGSAKKAQESLGLNFKRVRIYSTEGPNLDIGANPKTNEDRVVEQKAIKKINKVAPQLLFVGFGAPKQEKWVYRWLGKIKIGGAMVVGGTFDYVSGRAKLPPRWIEEAGLEWLWRLINQPKRARRIVNAVVVFSYKVFLDKLNREKVKV